MKYCFPNELWNIIKDYLLDWRKIWHRKLLIALNIDDHINGIRKNYPIILLAESYSLKKRLYYSYFLVPERNDKNELRVSNSYDVADNKWVDEFLPLFVP
jgi:hypothetical protein